jgi:hypothetical protein
MRLYDVRISSSALSDMETLRVFLDGMLSEEAGIS